MANEFLQQIDNIEKIISTETNGGQKDYSAKITFIDGQPIVKIDLLREQNDLLEDKKIVKPSSNLLS
jgi:hypothetical protein